MRNKLPRVPGQGTSRQAKVFTGIAGSQTGGSTGNPVAIDITEFPSGQTMSGNWPMQLPPSGAHSAVDVNVPYKFFGLTEPVSMLAQLAGQGFEDISALANLILLQKFMLGEEYMLLGGCATAVAAPSTPTVTARTATSGVETALSGVSTNVYVAVTATNFFGETAFVSASVGSAAPAATDVVDITIVPSHGALQYNIYVATGASAPASTSFHLAASGVGGSRYTLQGALPTATANPLTTDSGTGASSRYDGLVSIIAGKAAGGNYPAGFYGSYVKQDAAATASVDVFNTALEAMWSAQKADPAELIMEGSDIGRLSDDIRANASQNYRLFIAQSELASVLAGAAVAEFINPVTRKMIPIMVHPWLTQGTALLMTYTMPFPWTNVANAWEVTNVQDYLSVAWPVVDLSYRFSLLLYGSLVGYAAPYSGIIQGLQKTVQSSTASWT